MSIRKFDQVEIPEEVMNKAFENAILAPNSSNMQTWDFYWLQNEEKKKELREYCFNQAAARTAVELVVVTADYKKWKRSQPQLVEFAKSVKAPKVVMTYYEKLMPLQYSPGFFNILGFWKAVIAWGVGLKRAVPRGPYTKKDLQMVAVKSAALACQNFVLSLTAQGYATCMMEGFDEKRVSKLLGLSSSAKVVMVIGIGGESSKGTWGPRFRIPSEECIHRI